MKERIINFLGKVQRNYHQSGLDSAVSFGKPETVIRHAGWLGLDPEQTDKLVAEATLNRELQRASKQEIIYGDYRGAAERATMAFKKHKEQTDKPSVE